jgi:hypothetical protein
MAAPLKLSGPMFDALEAFRQNDTDILPAYWIRVGTAVALMRRGLISAERFNRHQLTPEGARQLSIDYTIFVERAREQALAEDADRVACIAPGCDAAFMSGRRFSYDTDFTATQRMQLHAAAAHVPIEAVGWVALSKPLTTEQWESARRYILSDDTGVDTREVPKPTDKWSAMIPDPHPLENCGPLQFALPAGTQCPTCGTVVAGPAPALQRTAEEAEFATAAMEPGQSFATVLDWVADGIRGGLPIPSSVSYVGSVIGVHVVFGRNRPNDLAAWARHAGARVVPNGSIHYEGTPKAWRSHEAETRQGGMRVEMWTAVPESLDPPAVLLSTEDLNAAGSGDYPTMKIESDT